MADIEHRKLSRRLSKHAERVARTFDASGVIVLVLFEGGRLGVGSVADQEDGKAVEGISGMLDVLRRYVARVSGAPISPIVSAPPDDIPDDPTDPRDVVGDGDGVSFDPPERS
jgi:hypothetical protein